MPTNAINDTGVKYLYDKLHGEIEPIAEAVSDSEVTIEGNPLSFSTLSSQNAKSTILSCEPIQDLHGYDKPWVGGAGKNLLKAKNYASDDYDGTVFTNVGYDNLISESVTLSAGTYTVSIKLLSRPSTNRTITFRESRYSGTEIGVWNNLNTREINTVYSNTVTLSESLTISGWLYGSEGGTFKIQMMIEKSSTATSFAPYENICPISGRTEIGILGCGKNIINTDDFVENGYIKSDGTIGVASFWKYAFINVIPNSTYSISGLTANSGPHFCTYDADLKFKRDLGTHQDMLLTILSDEKYIGVTLNSDEYATVQLEKGNQATTYSPYTKSNDLTISLGQTVYGGTLDVENGVLVVDRKGYDMGDLSWTYHSPSGIYTAFFDTYLPNDSIVGDGRVAANIISPLYETIPSGIIATEGHDNGVQALAFSTRRFITCDKRYSDATSYTEAVDGQIVVYELATPITINLTPHTINLLKGVNNISTDGDKITLTYRDGKVATLGDLTSAVDNLDSKIDESKILTDTATGDKYILVVTNGVLSVEQISN